MKSLNFIHYLEYVIEISKENSNFIENLLSNFKLDFNIEVNENYLDELPQAPSINDEYQEILKMINHQIKLSNLVGYFSQSDYYYYLQYYEENKEKLKLYILTQEEENLYETIINSMNNSINDLNKVNNMYKNLENEILQKLDIT